MDNEVMDSDKELLKEKARLLNNIFNVYLVLYLILAVFYGANKFADFSRDEYYFAKILLLIWVVAKPVIIFFVIKIKTLLKQSWPLLGLIALVLPFGEIFAANIVIRNVVEVLAKDEDFSGDT